VKSVDFEQVTERVSHDTFKLALPTSASEQISLIPAFVCIASTFSESLGSKARLFKRATSVGCNIALHCECQRALCPVEVVSMHPRATNPHLNWLVVPQYHSSGQQPLTRSYTNPGCPQNGPGCPDGRKQFLGFNSRGGTHFDIITQEDALQGRKCIARVLLESVGQTV
jgi:hypothetical protein